MFPVWEKRTLTNSASLFLMSTICCKCLHAQLKNPDDFFFFFGHESPRDTKDLIQMSSTMPSTILPYFRVKQVECPFKSKKDQILCNYAHCLFGLIRTVSKCLHVPTIQTDRITSLLSSSHLPQLEYLFFFFV